MVDRIPLLNGSSDSTSKFRRQPVKPTLASDEAKDVYNNYIMFSILFSTNHACVITCLAYASAELGNYLGALSSGTLYLTYALVALCFSKLVLALMGSKATMIIASMGYSIYVAGFFFALVSPKELALHISIWTSLVGGACGGLLWGAQSYYYWKCAKRYSLVGNISVSVAQEYLSSAFTFIFIITEILFKCIASIHMVYYMYVGKCLNTRCYCIDYTHEITITPITQNTHFYVKLQNRRDARYFVCVVCNGGSNNLLQYDVHFQYRARE